MIFQKKIKKLLHSISFKNKVEKKNKKVVNHRNFYKSTSSLLTFSLEIQMEEEKKKEKSIESNPYVFYLLMDGINL